MTQYIVIIHFAILAAIILLYIFTIIRLIWLRRLVIPMTDLDKKLVVVEQSGLAVLIILGAYIAYQGEPESVRQSYHAYYFFAPALVVLASLGNVWRMREKKKAKNEEAEGRMLVRVGLPLAVVNLALIIGLFGWLVF